VGRLPQRFRHGFANRLLAAARAGAEHEILAGSRFRGIRPRHDSVDDALVIDGQRQNQPFAVRESIAVRHLESSEAARLGLDLAVAPGAMADRVLEIRHLDVQLRERLIGDEVDY